MTTVEPPPRLEVRQVSKRFTGVRALHNVDLAVRQGEVLSVVGENGAGKSTLMKILAGIQVADSGSVFVEARQVRIASVTDATDHGIALIHQELNLADNLQVGDNIFLGREPRRFGIIDRRQILRQATTLLDQIGLDVSPTMPLAQLPIGRQQMVEIAKALSVNAKVLIMDEPTSSLSSRESAALFEVIRELREQGVSIIYISHRLGEVEELSDRVVILRDGENAGELQAGEISHDRMVRLMVGRDVTQFYAREQHVPGDVRLDVSKIVTSAWPRHAISLTVRGGEIVGLAGLVGAGRSELLSALFGVEHPISGVVRVDGEVVLPGSPPNSILAGMALVPEDRKQQGLVIEMAVRHNISLASLRQNRRWGGRLNLATEKRDAAEMIARLQIKTQSDMQEVKFLSGGNQQKVVLGKWLVLQPRVLLLDEPTRGIDVGAKQEIYRLMEQLARDGVAILFVSSEMEEILGMSDRAFVMHEGCLMGELLRRELTEEAVMQLATGNPGQVTEVRRDKHS